jgi:hypothetical protein
MISEEQKRRIRLYMDRSRFKAACRRADAAEAALGRIEEIQERNRALPHASQFEFQKEEALPKEEERSEYSAHPKSGLLSNRPIQLPDMPDKSKRLASYGIHRDRNVGVQNDA